MKSTWKNLTILLALLIALVACGCAKNLVASDAPVLEGTVTDLAVQSGSSITLDMSAVEAYDINGEDLTLVVFGGENYRVTGTTITPDPSYVGDLEVMLAVSDGQHESNRLPIIISVVRRVEIMPLLKQAWWEYSDTTFGDTGGVSTSRLEIAGVFGVPIAGFDSNRVYVSRWLTADSIDVSYLYYDSTGSGTWCVGAIAGGDTVVSPVVKIRYPVTVGEVWPYTNYLYNLTDSLFVQDSTVEQIACTGGMIYRRVPAGVFPCWEYTYTARLPAADVSGVAKLRNVILVQEGMAAATGDAQTRTVKMYYSPGVGYVQYEMYLDGVLVRKKSLINYSVVEQ